MSRQNQSTQRRGRGPRPVGEAVGRLTGKAIRRRGFSEARVITEWPRIVGELLAPQTLPDRLVVPRGAEDRDGGTLHLRATGGAATELQHLAPILIERINTYFGYRAVAQLKIWQGPLPENDHPKPVAAAPIDRAEHESIERAVAQVEDDGLRDSLTALGRALAAREADEA
ncbi:MAG: DciA family protein [Alphaproteobacteria bacterium]|nr:DciA family protein [Alphaproteobacteria bacterium]